MVPFGLIEGILSFLIGLLVGSFYNCAGCCFSGRSATVRAKGCYIIRESLIFLAIGLSMIAVFPILHVFRDMSPSQSWRYRRIPTFIGMCDVTRTWTFRYGYMPKALGNTDYVDGNTCEPDGLKMWKCAERPELDGNLEVGGV